jgi:hypothetical protein
MDVNCQCNIEETLVGILFSRCVTTAKDPVVYNVRRQILKVLSIENTLPVASTWHASIQSPETDWSRVPIELMCPSRPFL